MSHTFYLHFLAIDFEIDTFKIQIWISKVYKSDLKSIYLVEGTYESGGAPYKEHTNYKTVKEL